MKRFVLRQSQHKYTTSLPQQNELDVLFYLTVYSDLVSKGITNENLALKHYQQFGKAEKRYPNKDNFYLAYPQFNWNQYARLNKLPNELSSITHFLHNSNQNVSKPSAPLVPNKTNILEKERQINSLLARCNISPKVETLLVSFESMRANLISATKANIQEITSNRVVSENITTLTANVTSLSNSLNLTVHAGPDGELEVGEFSDIRLKNNIANLENPTHHLLELTPRTFNWNDTRKYGEKPVAGFIAQEVMETSLQGIVYEIDGYFGIDSIKLMPYVIGSIKELVGEVNTIKQSLGS